MSICPEGGHWGPKTGVPLDGNADAQTQDAGMRCCRRTHHLANRTGESVRHVLLTTTAAVCAATLLPAAASAKSNIAYIGDTIVVTADPGERNTIVLSGEDADRIGIGDSTEGEAFPADRCTQISSEYAAQCELPAKIRVNLGDGDDTAFVFHNAPKIPIEILGGSGADELKGGSETPSTLDGGTGADQIESQDASDVLRGGDGPDTLLGGGGNDQLYGEGDTDILKPDSGASPLGADLVDGGAGNDMAEDWWSASPSERMLQTTITVDGVANDGRPGEGDNVISVETIRSFAAGSFTTSDADDHVELYAATDQGPSTASTLGGNDVVIAGNGSQTLDGGAGNDRLEGGFGSDTITGGPGKDTISGDFTGSQCGVFQSCTIPHGDDVITARDGEVDTIDCGVGNDKAIVDAVDVVSNCETVVRDGNAGGNGAGTGNGGAGGSSGGGGSNGAGTGAGSGPVRLAETTKLKTALTRGVKVKLTGLKPGKRAPVKARIGGKVVASGSAKASSAGDATVTLRFTKAAKRQLAGKKTVTLEVSAGKISGPVTLTR